MAEETLEGLRTLTVAEFAAASGINEERIRILVREGKGPPHVRFDRRIRFRLKDIEEWLAAQATRVGGDA